MNNADDLANIFPYNVEYEIRKHESTIYSPDREIRYNSIDADALIMEIDGLGERLSGIIRQRFQEHMKLREIAKYHSITTTRIQQLIHKGLRKIKERMNNRWHISA